jgi:2-polyprenyl-3-methyl-5-hydroxy-6-metoxy-1,4-benzoquinol methylase
VAVVTVGERLRARVRSTVRRLVVSTGRRVGLEVYEPNREHSGRLEALAEYVEDTRPVRDKRAEMLSGRDLDLTITTEGLADVLDVAGSRGARILEVGPKYGLHSLWLDRELEPSELVFLDLPTEERLHDGWRGRLRSPHRFVYADLRDPDALHDLGEFDLVLCLGVLYHSVYHVQMLAALNRATRPGGLLLVETTVDPRTDTSVRLRWPVRNAKAKAVPTVEATRLMLAWTGWRRVTRFVDYRPGSSEAVFLCEKTDELVEGTDFAAIVRPHRQIGSLTPEPAPLGRSSRATRPSRFGRGRARVAATGVGLVTFLLFLFVFLPEELLNDLAQAGHGLDAVGGLRLGEQRDVLGRALLAALVPEMEKGPPRTRPAATEAEPPEPDRHVHVLPSPALVAHVVAVDALEVRPVHAEQEAVAVGMRRELGEAGTAGATAVSRGQRPERSRLTGRRPADERPALDRQLLGEHATRQLAAELEPLAGDEPAGHGRAPQRLHETAPRDRVAVDEDEEVAARVARTEIPNARQPVAVVLLPRVRQPSTETGAPRLDDCRRRRSRAVVADDDVEVGIGLVRETAQNGLERLRPLVRRDEDRELHAVPEAKNGVESFVTSAPRRYFSSFQGVSRRPGRRPRTARRTRPKRSLRYVFASIGFSRRRPRSGSRLDRRRKQAWTTRNGLSSNPGSSPKWWTASQLKPGRYTISPSWRHCR